MDDKEQAAQTDAGESLNRKFAVILLLFVSFRVLAIAAFRPGGLVLDFSDFYWYRAFAELTRQGYYPYFNLWTTYPPLFPFLMIGVWKVSTLIPPWDFPNLWFTLLLGGVFLLFETGNLVLIYLISRSLYEKNGTDEDVLLPCWFYGMLFVPVYTLTGWFESYPLFFFLLSLYLLIRGRPYLSALTTGIGAMIKLVPVVLLPVGARAAGLVLTRDPREWRAWLKSTPGPLIYTAIAMATIAAILAPFYFINPQLALGSFQISAAREPWETIWALVGGQEGRYTYGIIPLDMRDLSWDPAAEPPSPLPWLPITLAFGAVGLAAYTLPLDWKKPRVLASFSALTLMLFMLYSKGYSPQWLGWPLVFIALLTPNLRGAFYAVVLGTINVLEANFYFIMFPAEHWLLWATVGIRTFLFVVLAAEFLLAAHPPYRTRTVEFARRQLLIALTVVLVIGAVPAAMRLGRAYHDTRLERSRYRNLTNLLQEQAGKDAALVLNSQHVYDWLYPYLRGDYAFYMLDDYAPPGYSLEEKEGRVMQQVMSHDEWWLIDSTPTEMTPGESAALGWLSTLYVPPAEVLEIDGLKVYHYRSP